MEFGSLSNLILKKWATYKSPCWIGLDGLRSQLTRFDGEGLDTGWIRYVNWVVVFVPMRLEVPAWHGTMASGKP